MENAKGQIRGDWKTQTPGLSAPTSQTGVHPEEKRKITPAEHSNDDRPRHADII